MTMTTHTSNALTSLRRDAHGRLTLTLSVPPHATGGAAPAEVVHEGVVPVRAYPISAPGDGLSLVSSDGHELVWIDRLDALPAEVRKVIDEELAVREFMPIIRCITSVSTFSTPSNWSVDTDRGPTTFTLKTEDDIRRIGAGRLLIASGQGMQFSIPHVSALDRPSRKLLERFL
jgi:hypothetical protein